MSRPILAPIAAPIVAVALAFALLTSPGTVRADDANIAVHDLASSSDFRVRVSAALEIGRSKPPGAREALEAALNDSHAAVRVAAAEALGSLEERAAVPALQDHLASDSSANVRAQIQVTLDRLRALTSATASAGEHALPADVRCVVVLGAMRNPSGTRGEELRQVLGACSSEDAARGPSERGGRAALAAGQRETYSGDRARRKRVGGIGVSLGGQRSGARPGRVHGSPRPDAQRHRVGSCDHLWVRSESLRAGEAAPPGRRGQRGRAKCASGCRSGSHRRRALKSGRAMEHALHDEHVCRGPQDVSRVLSRSGA
jgi:HEAT repeats